MARWEELSSFFTVLNGLKEELVQMRQGGAGPVVTMEQRIDNLECKLSTLTDTVVNWLGALTTQVDAQDAYSRRNCLLFHGILEQPHEDTAKIVLDMLKDKGIGAQEITYQQVSRSHRLGPARPNRQNPRPIIVRFTTYNARDVIFKEKKKLKGTGMTITEQLTGTRMKIMKAAKEAFGMRNVWSTDGSVVVLHEGRKNKVNTHAALENLKAQLLPATTSAPPILAPLARDAFVNSRPRTRTPNTTPNA